MGSMNKRRSVTMQRAYRYQQQIQERLGRLSTAEQLVATHLVAHPEQVPFETARTLARRLGLSAMTVGRTLKALGYQGLGELRLEMRSEVPDSTAAPWVQRRAATVAQSPKNVERARAMRAEVEAVEAVHALAETAPWREAVGLIAGADQVFVVGFQTERGLALAFADQLSYVRSHVRRLAVEDRAFADLRAEATSSSCLVMVDCRRYSSWFRLLARKAGEVGVPVIIVTDAYCSWASRMTSLALQARTDSGRFWDNPSPICSLLNLLIEDVIERIGEPVHRQLDAASEFCSAFMGFDRVHRLRNKRGEGVPRTKGQRAPDAGGRVRKKVLGGASTT